MKRNILTLGLAVLIGCGALTGIAAGRYERLKQSGEKARVTHIDKNSFLAKRRAESGNKQLNGLFSSRDGLLTIRHQADFSNTRSIESPRGHFIGAVGDYGGMNDMRQAFMGTIDAATGHVERLFSTSAIINGNDYDFQGGAIRDGIYYTTATASDNLGDIVLWNRVDVETGDVMTPVRFGYGDFSAYAYSMAYNEAEDLFYCLSIDLVTESPNMLSVVDPNQDFKVISTVSLSINGAFAGGLAYNPADQQVYCFCNDGSVYTVEQGNPRPVQTGIIENGGDYIETNVSTQVAYSPLDECFVMIYRDARAREISLAYISPDDWSVTKGKVLAGNNITTPYFISLICTDPYAENDAPAYPAAPVVTFDKNALEGTVSFTAPDTYYSGVSISASTQVATVVKIDDKEIFNGNLAPGESKTVNSTLEQGLHALTMVCTVGGYSSPVRTVNFYVGNDIPTAPRNVKLDGDLLTWTAPGAVGVNKGYVDTEAITYDIFIGETKQNTEPVKGTQFTITQPDDLKFSRVSVKAIANGQTSAAGYTEQVIGKALELPVVMEPSVPDSELFTVMNPDGDDSMFFFTDDRGYFEFCIGVGYYGKANDWLFMPLMSFADTEHLYNLAFTYANMQYDGSESLDIYLAKKLNTNTAEMINIFRGRNIDFPNDHNYSLNFGVPEAGDYYIAFHCTSPGGAASGVRLRDFAVNSLRDQSSDVPGDPTDVKITAADKGELYANVNVTLPTLNAVGKALNASDDVTVNVTCGDKTGKATGKPGATVTARVDVEQSGYSFFDVTPSNAKGSGLTRTYRAYVGLDVPLCPQNIVGIPSDDNMSMKLTWEKPSNVGEHGGYVNPDDLDYIIYNVPAAAFYQVGQTRGFEFTYHATSETQERYVLGPSARNSVGESINSLFVGDVLGQPNRLPIIEHFGNSAFDYNPTYNNLAGEFDGSAFQSCTSIMADIYYHNAKEDCDNGALAVYSTVSRKAKAELVLPKFSTLSVGQAAYTVRYLDYQYAPSMSLWARYPGHNDYEKIGDFPMDKPVNGVWRDGAIELPERLLNKGWVQCVIRFDLESTPEEYGFIDGYSITQDVDFDLNAAGISGKDHLFSGETSEYTITIVNAGKESINRGAATMIVRLKDKDGNIILRNDTPLPRMLSLQSISTVFNLSAKEDYAAKSPLSLEVTTVYDEDEVEWNNTTSRQISIVDAQAPVVRDLEGKWDDAKTGITLNWSEPDTRFQGLESFEMVEGFEQGENLGVFRNVDMDGMPVFPFSNPRWEGDGDPTGWMIVDTNDFYIWKGDARMDAHSGTKYVMARIPYYDDTDTNSNPTQAADWLISPEVVGGTEVSFWYGTISSDYTEYVELYYSSTDDTLGDVIDIPEGGSAKDGKCGSFKYIRTFSKEGTEAWEHVSFTLPQDAKYFALVFRSFDTFGAMLDDIEFTPAQQNSVYDIDHYSVWRLTDDDWNTWSCMADNLKATTFTDTTITDDHNATYYVITYTKSGNIIIGGPRSNPARVFCSGVDGINGISAHVAGVKGGILVSGYAANEMRIFTTDGKLIREATVQSDAETFSLEAGIYIVRVGKADYKVVVK